MAAESEKQSEPNSTDLRYWLVDHGFPTVKYMGRILNSYLICMSSKVLSHVNKSLN